MKFLYVFYGVNHISCKKEKICYQTSQPNEARNWKLNCQIKFVFNDMFNMDFDFSAIFLRLKLHSLVASKQKKIWHSIHHHQMFPKHRIDWFLFLVYLVLNLHNYTYPYTHLHTTNLQVCTDTHYHDCRHTHTHEYLTVNENLLEFNSLCPPTTSHIFHIWNCTWFFIPRL